MPAVLSWALNLPVPAPEDFPLLARGQREHSRVWERCRESVWDNVWSKGHPLAGSWEPLPSLHVVESTSTAWWEGTNRQGRPQGAQSTWIVYVTSDGGGRTVPLSTLSFLSQTLSPLSCCEDLEPWQKSAVLGPPTLGSTHKLSPGLHCVTAGSATGTSVLKYGMGDHGRAPLSSPCNSCQPLQHEALTHLYISRSTTSSKQAPACHQWCHRVSSHNQGQSGRGGRAQPCSGGIKVPVMSTAISTAATSLSPGEVPGEVGMCLTQLREQGQGVG